MAPRPLRPKDDPNAPEGSDTAPDSKSNKRRAVSSACIPCRKRKSKCDGAMPSCSTCTAVYRTECSYDADSDHRRKGALKRDIQCLQQANDALDVIVASLRSLPEEEAVSLLHSLRGDSSPDVLAASLRTNVRLPPSYAPQTLEADFAQQMATPSSSNFDSVPFSRELSREVSLTDSQSFISTTNALEGSANWFRHAQDPEFVEHLLNLYFTWVHPFYPFFSRDLFLQDMANGRTEFCSSILVNAILAYACNFSDRAAARTDPNNPLTAGDQYFYECKRLLDNDDEKPTLTTVQALGVMSIRQCSHGRESAGYQLVGRCLRVALELGLHLSVIGSGLKPVEAEVRKLTFWTVFNLETTCAVSFGRLSLLPRAAADVNRPAVNERSESIPWRPYADSGLAPSPSAEQPGRPLLFLDYLSQLSEMASDMVNTFYAPQERFTSRRLNLAYQQYQDWRQNLPDAFKLENTSLPHVLVMHMYYYACVLHLFRPYIKLDLRGAGLYPRDTCTYCANEISSLMGALRAMFGLRRVTHIVCSLLMSASTIHLLNLPSDTAAANLSQGVHDLQAMSVNHQFAANCINIIQSLATKWNITLPEGAASVGAYRGVGGKTWPSPPASAFFAASIPRKPSSGSGNRSDSSMSGSQRAASHASQSQAAQQSQQVFPTFYSDPTTPMEATQAQHAFWTPFPVQGVPSQNQAYNDLAMDFQGPATDGMQGMQWPTMFGGSVAPPTTEGGPTSHPATSGAMMDATMGTMSPLSGMGSNMADWQWH